MRISTACAALMSSRECLRKLRKANPLTAAFQTELTPTRKGTAERAPCALGGLPRMADRPDGCVFRTLTALGSSATIGALLGAITVTWTVRFCAVYDPTHTAASRR
jgi:hypothetical protein